MEMQRAKNSKAILKKLNKVEKLYYQDFFFNTVVINTVWYSHIDRGINH